MLGRGALVFLGLSAGLIGPAWSGVTVSEQTKTYAVAGRTGAALLDAMDRKGPKHGFLTRAIAQTSYAVSWKIEWGETRKSCRVTRVDGELAITYTYPRPSSDMSADLRHRWNAFIAGVRKHEARHGELAREMARAAEKAVGRVSIANDRGCVKARREVKRRMASIYAEYEARQVSFDAREHRNGGKVEKLILGLVRRR